MSKLHEREGDYNNDDYTLEKEMKELEEIAYDSIKNRKWNPDGTP